MAASTFGLTFLIVTDTTKLVVENGGIYDGFNGTVQQNLCLEGKSDTISSQHYYKYNQTACCKEYTDFNTTDTPPTASYGNGTKCSDDATLTWLDIVLVLDVCNAMTKVDQLSATLVTIVQGLTIGQNSDHTTRIGIITFGTDVTILQQLKDTTTEDLIIDILFGIKINANDPGGNMGGALKQAYNHILSQRTYRKPLILLTSAAYNDEGFMDVNATANSIKADGMKIMVINYAENDLVLTGALKGIASDGYYYVSSAEDLIPSVLFGFTQINCYCSATTIQLSLYNEQWLNYTNYADCFLGVLSPSNPTIANKYVCKLPGSLVSLTSQAKQDFIIDNFFVKGDPLYGEKKFSIGLHKSDSDGTWKWWGYNGTEIPYDNFPPMAKPPASNDNYGYMLNDYGFHWALQTGYNTALKYICQSPACDAANVCKNLKFKIFCV
uniref:VWFA domain-containing protein n=1 Tax=Panagrolaimus davidi TaxID=227884 RepID=A0A914QMA8_9BILA